VRVSDATSSQLNWLVAKCEGELYPQGHVRLIGYQTMYISPGAHEVQDSWHQYSPSTDWAQGGPIIERECIELRYHAVVVAGIWYRDGIGIDECTHKAIDPTPLIAAMRCLVLSKLGEEVEVPDGLL
jgi:hypothetical protein